MEDTDWLAKRQAAIHLLRSGCSLTEVAQCMERPVSWVSKWRDRYKEEGWAGLKDRSHAPKNPGQAHPESVRRAVRQARSESPRPQAGASERSVAPATPRDSA